MSTAGNFTLAALNGTTLTGLRSMTYDERTQESILGSDGSLHQTNAAIIRAAPMARGTTVSVRTLFSTLGTGDEVPFVALNGSTGLVLYGGVINTAAPGYAGSGSHRSITGLNGTVFLESVRWSAGQAAEADFVTYFKTSSGGTSPVTKATNASLPTIPAASEQLVLTACTLNSVSLTSLLSVDVTVNPGAENNSDECYSLGLPYPVLVTQAGAGGQTEVTATIETTALVATVGSGDLVLTFTAMNALGTGVGSGTATVTINGVLARDEVIQGDNGAPARRRIQIRGTYDGNNAPITIATA